MAYQNMTVPDPVTPPPPYDSVISSPFREFSRVSVGLQTARPPSPDITSLDLNRACHGSVASPFRRAAVNQRNDIGSDDEPKSYKYIAFCFCFVLMVIFCGFGALLAYMTH